MTTEELTRTSAARMSALVRSGEVSPVDLVEAHLGKIERLNPRLNAFVHVDAEGARAEARRREREAPAGALHGVPISIKSSIAVAGFPWECGSILRTGVIAGADAPLVRRLKDAGAIVLGNTNVPELLMAWETDNVLYGRTNNPWDPERTPGGSSGGEAAAIAAGLSAGGVGSDGGGSIRVPAHFTGICGLKPTPGRVPATGHFPASAGPFAHLGVVGPMARTVEDVEILFRVLAGADDGDPSAAPVPHRPLAPEEARKLPIGWFDGDGRTPVSPRIRSAVRDAASALAGQGFQVREFRPEGLASMRELWWNLFGRAGGLVLGPLLAGRASELSPILTQFRDYVGEMPPLGVEELMETLLERDRVRTALLDQMREFPILLCPVSAVHAFRHGEREWEIGGARVRYLDAWSYTAWFNLTGSPAMSVPVPSAGLPVGVQIVGRPWNEESVLAVAAQLEAAVGAAPLPSV